MVSLSSLTIASITSTCLVAPVTLQLCLEPEGSATACALALPLLHACIWGITNGRDALMPEWEQLACVAGSDGQSQNDNRLLDRVGAEISGMSGSWNRVCTIDSEAEHVQIDSETYKMNKPLDPINVEASYEAYIVGDGRHVVMKKEDEKVWYLSTFNDYVSPIYKPWQYLHWYWDFFTRLGEILVKGPDSLDSSVRQKSYLYCNHAGLKGSVKVVACHQEAPPGQCAEERPCP